MLFLVAIGVFVALIIIGALLRERMRIIADTAIYLGVSNLIIVLISFFALVFDVDYRDVARVTPVTIMANTLLGFIIMAQMLIKRAIKRRTELKAKEKQKTKEDI